jgi:hypothetical protein
LKTKQREARGEEKEKIKRREEREMKKREAVRGQCQQTATHHAPSVARSKRALLL